MRTKIFPVIIFFIFFALLCVSPSLSENIPDPETFFGHKPGADFKLIWWENIH